LRQTLSCPRISATYVVRLVSDPTRFVSRLAFQYPDEPRAKWAALYGPTGREQTPTPNCKLKSDTTRNQKAGVLPMSDTLWTASISITSSPAMRIFRPDHVFDDGQHTLSDYPNDGRFRELPTLLLVVNARSELVNSAVDGSRYIVDVSRQSDSCGRCAARSRSRDNHARDARTPRPERRTDDDEA